MNISYDGQAATDPRSFLKRYIWQNQDYSSHMLEINDGTDYVLDLQQIEETI